MEYRGTRNGVEACLGLQTSEVSRVAWGTDFDNRAEVAVSGASAYEKKLLSEGRNKVDVISYPIVP